MKKNFKLLAATLMGALAIGCTPGGEDGNNPGTNPEGGEQTPELTYDLRVLTFEDADYKGSEASSTYWSDFIPDGPYGNGNARYSWYDEGNTELAYYPAYSLYGMGGHAGISNYVGNDPSQGSYLCDLQAYNVEGGANGSQNFCVHFGYLDDSGMGMMDRLIYFEFGDETARVIDHMWVTNTTYVYNNLANGVSDFGGTYTPSESSYLKIVAYGYESADDAEATTVEFYLGQGLDYVSTWTKWDMSSLGAVVKVEFNIVGSPDMYGAYGFMLPGYFAYDDVAVRFDKTTVNE
ncbi:MAG: DUF4465 domain-containing protein [Alistipes sp.]|nr:DUF4465 domain-containing protein [Alistipes sp.]